MSFELAKLAPVTRLSETVLRVLGQNPGPYTLQGTNTYLVGRTAPFILIDTGEGKPTYPGFLREALEGFKSSSTQSPLVSDIIITHKHRDHHGGLSSTLKLLKELQGNHPQSSERLPRLHKFPLATGEELDDHLRSVTSSLEPGTFEEPSTVHARPQESCFHPLSNGQVLQGEGAELRVLHTPGHTSDSVCLYLPQDGALFTADNVLGHGTAVFEDLSTYLASLRVLLDYDYAESGLKRIYPGHGPVIEGDAARATIEMYISHRLEREQQLVAVLKSQDKAWSVDDVVEAVYPENVRMMAKRGVLPHLRKLEADARVSKTDADVQRWKLVE